MRAGGPDTDAARAHSAVVAALLIAIAFFGRQGREGRQGHEDRGREAAPPAERGRNEARDEVALAAAALFGDIERLAELARDFGPRAAELVTAPGVEGTGAARAAVGVEKSLAGLTAALDRGSLLLVRAEPTVAQCAAVYRGLMSTDATMLAAAAAYEAAGQLIAAAPALRADGAPPASLAAVKALGDAIGELGSQVRRIARGVRCLGVALGAE